MELERPAERFFFHALSFKRLNNSLFFFTICWLFDDFDIYVLQCIDSNAEIKGLYKAEFKAMLLGHPMTTARFQ